MTTMRMASEMIEANPDDSVQVRSVELMRAQMERFELLLVDLLEISRFDAGDAQLAVEDCDISELVRSEIIDGTPLADRLGVPIMLVAEDAQTAEVDPRRISRIVRNLLSNAVEHAEGKTVEVTVAGNDCAVGVAVRDHGVGFEPCQAEKVFGRFWRGDPSRVRTVGGSGLRTGHRPPGCEPPPRLADGLGASRPGGLLSIGGPQTARWSHCRVPASRISERCWLFGR